MVEDMLAYKGIIVTHKTIRECGYEIRTRLCQHNPSPYASSGDKWHLDEVVITLKGERHFLWCAVDQDGFVLEELEQKRCNTKAAKCFIRKLLSGQSASPALITASGLTVAAMAETASDPRRKPRREKRRLMISPMVGLSDGLRGAASASSNGPVLNRLCWERFLTFPAPYRTVKLQIRRTG